MRHFTREEINGALRARHGAKIQEALGNAHVAIAGLGGLGSNVAFSLCRIGVGHIHIIDFDIVDLTNLNRQQYFLEHVGMYKTEALKSELLNINPYIDITLDTVKVSPENIKDLFMYDNIICEAFDNPEAKAMLTENASEIFPDKKIVCASGLAGYESSNLIKTKKLGKNIYLCGDGINGASQTMGLMAPRAALCAAHEANIITRLILGQEEP